MLTCCTSSAFLLITTLCDCIVGFARTRPEEDDDCAVGDDRRDGERPPGNQGGRYNKDQNHRHPQKNNNNVKSKTDSIVTDLLPWVPADQSSAPKLQFS